MPALKASMDLMRRPIDPFTATPSLIRQPSAEDLDAAHQLVSSARGECCKRIRTEERPRIHGHFLDSGFKKPTARPPIRMRQPVTNGPSALSGQVCRYGISLLPHRVSVANAM